MGACASAPAGKYHLQEVKLGQGSFSTVWQATVRAATDKDAEQILAVKQIDKARMRSLSLRGRTMRQVQQDIQVMRKCRNAGPTILKLHSNWEDRQSVFLALTYCDGGDFGNKLQQMKDQMDEKLIAQWMLDVCTAIFELHSRGVVHRDIKPDNFMVKTDNSMVVGGRLVLSDFGWSVFLKKNQQLNEKCGTNGCVFMAPEMEYGLGYGFPVDLWAAGVMQYMMMNKGQHPEKTPKLVYDTFGPQVVAPVLLKDGPGVASKLGNQNVSAFLMSLISPESRFSEGCQNLCTSLLQNSPATRLSAQAALESGWLQDGQHAKL